MWIKYIQLLLIAIIGSIIAVEDIKHRSVSVILILLHLIIILSYTIHLDLTYGLILSGLISILTIIVIVKKLNADIIYIILACGIIILCRIHNTFNPILVGGIGICTIIIVTLADKKNFPFLSCLTTLISVLCLVYFKFVN